MAIIQIIACKIANIIYFALLLMVLGHILPEPEEYINYNLAVGVALFLNGNENADSMYDAYSDIDMLIMLSITISLYILTMKLIKKTRSQ